LLPPPIRRLFGGGVTEEHPIFAPSAACGGCAPKRACGRSALRSGCFCTALRAIARHSLLVVGQGCYLHPFAACSAADEQRNILALRSGCFCTALRAIARHSLLVVGKVATSTHSPPVRRRVNRGTSSLCAPAVFAPRFARLRGDSRAGKKITFPQKRKSQKEAPDTAWGRNTAPWVLSQQDKPSRMDIMAQFTLSHMILIIVPCRDNGVNTTRNVAPRRIFCIFVSTFGQYVKTACKPLFSQRNISYRPSIFAAAIAALPLFYQSKKAAPPLRERLPLQTIRCHAFSFIFAEQSLHSAQHIVLLFISANLLVDIIVQFFYCVSPLCIIHVDLFPWLRWF